MMLQENKYSLVNLSNSFLKCYGINPYHETIEEVDELIKGHKKIVILLFDGMGRNIQNLHLNNDSYIRSHYLLTIDSTFPPTTAAATTAVLSAKYPIETGWIAWDVYVESLKRNVILFKNKDYNTEEELPIRCDKDLIPYKSIIESINEKDKNNNAFMIQRKPINPDGPETIEDGYKILSKTLKENESCFIYYYFDSPDREMHENGIDSEIVKKEIDEIDSFTKRICEENKDTVFILIADHGHINVKYFDLSNHPELLNMLKQNVGGEKRNSFFFVKDEYKKEFKDLFLSLYGEHFLLLDKEEIYKTHLFGEGSPHPLFDSMLGDYLAISKDEYSLIASHQFKNPEFLKGHHAGGTKQEREIDVSIYNGNNLWK